MANEAHLRELGERRRARRHAWLFRLRVDYRRFSRQATEQRTRVEADALNATIQQQAIEQTFTLALGEELFMAHFHRQRAI
ncbi:hypothetical protein D3C81_1328710 [compost metagenome]